MRAELDMQRAELDALENAFPGDEQPAADSGALADDWEERFSEDDDDGPAASPSRTVSADDFDEDQIVGALIAFREVGQ